MRKQSPSRSAVSVIAGFIAAASIAVPLLPQVARAEGEDRTDSATYTASRADYWAARAAYDERRAAKDAGLPLPDKTAGVSTPAASAPADDPPAASSSGYPTNSQLAALRMCESTDNYGANTGNGYYGAYQFSPLTWWWLGYTGYPHNASPATQDQAVRDLYALQGWSPWPACSYYLGFR